MAKVAITCQRRETTKPAAAGVRATGKELLLVENADNSCTLMGTDPYGNAVDIRDFADVVITSSDTDIITVDDPDDSLTFRMRGWGASEPDKTIKVSFLVNWKDGSCEDAEFDLPCHVNRRDVPRGDIEAGRFVIVPETPVVRRGTLRSAVSTPPTDPNATTGVPYRDPQQQGEPYGPQPTTLTPKDGPTPIQPAPEPKPIVPDLPI